MEAPHRRPQIHDARFDALKVLTPTDTEMPSPHNAMRFWPAQAPQFGAVRCNTPALNTRGVPTMRFVVLDTNVLVADPGLQKPSFQLLFEEAAILEIQLCIPSVVINEFKAHVRRDLEELHGKEFKRLIEAVRKWAPEAPAPQFDVEACVAEASARLERRLVELRVRTLPVPTVGHAEILDRAVAKRAPFSVGGEGYVDALIWHSVLDLFGEGRDSLSFVTADGDFREAKTRCFSRALLDEVRAQNAADRFDDYLEIGGFIEVHVKPDPKVLERIRTGVEQEGELSGALSASILMGLDDKVLHLQPRTPLADEPRISLPTEIPTVTGIKLTKARRLPSARILVTGLARVSVESLVEEYRFWSGDAMQVPGLGEIWGTRTWAGLPIHPIPRTFDIGFHALLTEPATSFDHVGNIEILSVTRVDPFTPLSPGVSVGT